METTLKKQLDEIDRMFDIQEQEGKYARKMAKEKCWANNIKSGMLKSELLDESSSL